MKTFISIIAVSVLLPFASQADEFPTKGPNGFENVNKRKEYEYHGYEGEKIWTEFGRPYWRTEGKIEKPVAVKKAPEPVVQKVVEKKAAPKKEINLGSAHMKPITLDVKFQLNQAEIIQNYTSHIDQLGMALKANETVQVEIQGHTDTTGEDAFNNMLSLKRAQSVKNYLVEKFNVSHQRINVRGLGSTKPMVSNEERSGREQNRRVNVKVIK